MFAVSLVVREGNMIKNRRTVIIAGAAALILAGGGTAYAASPGNHPSSSGTVSGSVALLVNNNPPVTSTCTVEAQSGSVTVTPTTVSTQAGTFGGCLLSGLPAGATVVATAQNFAMPGIGTGATAIIYPQTATSVAVLLVNAGASSPDANGEFSFIATP
jgi:hypothetical protein